MNYTKKEFVPKSRTNNCANKTYDYIDESAQLRKRQSTSAFEVKSKICDKDATKIKGR